MQKSALSHSLQGAADFSQLAVHLLNMSLPLSLGMHTPEQLSMENCQLLILKLCRQGCMLALSIEQTIWQASK